MSSGPNHERNETEPAVREELESAIASGDSDRINTARFKATFLDPDWQWIQNQCLIFLESGSDQVRRTAATCLGHVARIHGHIDRPLVLGALERARSVIGDRVDDAIDDIDMYVPEAE